MVSNALSVRSINCAGDQLRWLSTQQGGPKNGPPWIAAAYPPI
jgi:hypothetical protein